MTGARKIGLVFGALIALTTLNVLAQVESMSGARFEQYADTAYWEVDVTCEGSDSVAVIQQVTRGVDWCLKGQSKGCDPDKDKVANKVCSGALVANKPAAEPKPVAAASAPKPAAQVRTQADIAAQEARQRRAREQAQARAQARAQRETVAAELRAKQLSLRQQRLQIEQEKIDLNQLELSLNAKARKIEDQLKELE